MYVRSTFNSSNFQILAPGTGNLDSSDSFGASVRFLSTAAGQYFAYGTWAVTAP